MLKSIVKVILFALLCFGIIEQSYRVYATGMTAFNPVRFNSMNMLLLSGLVEETPWEGIPYKLKPDLDTWFQGVKFKTNSVGLADQEYSLEKPADTFRVAVVGSSWTMATGAEQSDSYHAQLETELNELNTGTHYEFLNFGVEHYGLRELVETTRQRVPEWHPDALVVAITSYTAYLRWQDPSEDVGLPDQTYPFFESYVSRTLEQILSNRRFGRGLPEVRPVLKKKDKDLFNAQLRRALRALGGFARSNGVPVVVVWLSYNTPGPEIQDLFRSEAEELGIVFVEGYRALGEANKMNGHLYSHRFDNHPNKAGHRIIADVLLQAMKQNQILPDSFNKEKN